MDALLADLAKNSPVIGSTLLILWLSLPQLAERFAIVAKLMAPFSKKARQREQIAAAAEADAAEADRRKLLADAQAVAQTTATTATTAALIVVQEQCNACMSELRGLRTITGQVVDVLEDLLPQIPAEHRTRAREAIREARNAM